jgi:hypothetical protein
MKYSAPSGPHCGCCTEVSLPPATSLRGRAARTGADVTRSVSCSARCKLHTPVVLHLVNHQPCTDVGRLWQIPQLQVHVSA